MASPSPSPPYLSVVAASRNDDHGGDPLIRTQIFVDCFARQCEKYRLSAELILVDWNPVPGRPGLAGVLQLPAEASFCQGRVITVPAVLHDRFKYADRLPFYQMIAKNAGIRRAEGRFILATNIDIIFSDELMRFIGRQRLNPQKTLRVDRNDIVSGLSASMTLDETLEYAWNHPVRGNRRFQPRPLLDHLYGEDRCKRCCAPDAQTYRQDENFPVVEEEGVWSIRPRRNTPIGSLHTNACGDFMLLSREGWDAVRGYAEFASYSFHIDSFGLAAAHYGGFEEVALLPPLVCFHIEHSLGSGWTPEGEKELFARLQRKEILSPEWEVLDPLMNAMRRGEIPPAVNGPSWGLADFDLPEDPLLPGRKETGAVHPRRYDAPHERAVSALLLEFDLDRLTVWQERRAHAATMSQTLGYLRSVERDSADRLQTIVFYQDKLKAAQGDLEQTVAYLRSVERDSADRLQTIVFYQDKLKAAQAGLEQTVAYLRLVERDSAERLGTIKFYEGKLQEAYADLERNTSYLNQVERDSAERLASIHYYQDKLKSAYQDHEHNLAYLKQLHDEIAALRQTNANKDIVIDGLEARFAGLEQAPGGAQDRPAARASDPVNAPRPPPQETRTPQEHAVRSSG